MIARSKRSVTGKPRYSGVEARHHDQVTMLRPRPLTGAHRIREELRRYDDQLELVFNPLISRWEIWRLRRGQRHPAGEKSLYHWYHIYHKVAPLQWEDRSYQEPCMAHVYKVAELDLWRMGGAKKMSKEWDEQMWKDRRDSLKPRDDMVDTLMNDYVRMETAFSVGVGKFRSHTKASLI